MTTALILHPRQWVRDLRQPFNMADEERRMLALVRGFIDGWYEATALMTTALGLSYGAFSEISAPPYETLRSHALNVTDYGRPDEPGYILACAIAYRHSREHDKSLRNYF